MPAKVKYLTQAEFARLVGVTEPAIHHHIKTRKLKTRRIEGATKIDIQTELEKYFAISQRALQLHGSEYELKRLAIPKNLLTHTARTESDQMTVARAREQQEIFKAKRAQIDYELAVGKLLNREEVALEWRNVGVLLRKAVMNIPDRMAQLIAAESDPGKCHVILDRECRTILEDLANQLAAEETDEEGVELEATQTY